MKKKVIVLFVDNNPGVLARITLLFAQRGFNIASLTVSETCIEKVSRISIVVYADEATVMQVIKQSSKLVEVHCIHLPDEDNMILKDLLLLKIYARDSDKKKICTLADLYNAKIIDISDGSIILELVASPEIIDEYLNQMQGFEILEQTRTGITVMERGVVNFYCNL